jgi:hypothetical protein
VAQLTNTLQLTDDGKTTTKKMKKYTEDDKIVEE